MTRNSIGTAQLRPNAVTSAKVKNRSLRAADLAPGARTGQRGPRGPTGPTGQFVGTPEEWQPLALANGWDFYGGGHQQPGYRKDRQGVVHLRGLIKQTTGLPDADGIVGSLPAGYRPSVRTIFVVASGGASVTFAQLIVDPDGTLRRTTGGAVAEPDYTSLNGITFWPE